GAHADVVAWDGDPLEVVSSPTAVIIAGEAQSLESRQTRLRDRYLSLDESERPRAYSRP
ncbi:MAG TPA: amidohydrolase, partial [Hyphomonas atlantica]|nr:amidohydrolase [Hyphomonas atlantica]